jgi:hypothetical protein
MEQDAGQTAPWWADYSVPRLLTFLVVLIGVSAIPAGVVRAILVLRFGLPDGLLSSLAWAFSMFVPLFVVLWMRRSGRDGWLLRKDLRETRAKKHTANPAMKPPL